MGSRLGAMASDQSRPKSPQVDGYTRQQMHGSRKQQWLGVNMRTRPGQNTTTDSQAMGTAC